PVRPDSYVEINNFYTATIYEKGAEVIGMLKRLVGEDGYARALDLYFDRHDGDAATIEDWLMVFQDATGRDLTQFKRWYTEDGTPRVTVTEDWDGEALTLTFRQENPPTPGQPVKGTKHIPIALGLLNPNGDEILPTTVLELTEAEQTFRFPAASRPIPSILRGFSAPVILERATTPEERAFLLAHDTDPFNKWEAGRTLAKDLLIRMVTEGASPGPDWLAAMARVAFDDALDPAFRALALRLPGEDDLAATLHAAGIVPDPASIHAERRRMARALAQHLGPRLPALVAEMAEPGPFSPDARAAGRRSLRLGALGMLALTDDGAAARAGYAAADNMTDEVGTLAILLEVGQGAPELARFEARWSHDANVMDKWFMLQIMLAQPDRAAEVTDGLTRHPAFDWKNPNRFRSVIGALSANHAGFHHISGAGYALVADWLIRLDPLNPQTAARMSTAFETWRRYDADRQVGAQAALRRIEAHPGLSRDLAEMVGRMLRG
ncbi:MAG: aminopeptidase N, partial [Rhodobacteraceae bacterium PARR1]